MLTLSNNSDTLIIILHEIYGINQHVMNICRDYSRNGYDIICPNLIGIDFPFGYIQQEEAYQHFIRNVGFEHAAQQVKKMIIQERSRYKFIFILGFSIGATIAWLCSNENQICDGVIGYYGSRIRDYLDVVPKCPMLLFFPKEEKSFNVQELIQLLNRKNVTIYEFIGNHGFSDPFNENYCDESTRKAEKFVETFLRKIICYSLQ